MTDETKPVDAPKKCPICCADQIKAGNVGRGEKCPSCKLRHTDACDCELCKVDAPKNDAREWLRKNFTYGEYNNLRDEEVDIPDWYDKLSALLEAYASQFIEQRDAAQKQCIHLAAELATDAPALRERLSKAESECAALRQQLQAAVKAMRELSIADAGHRRSLHCTAPLPVNEWANLNDAIIKSEAALEEK